MKRKKRKQMRKFKGHANKRSASVISQSSSESNQIIQSVEGNNNTVISSAPHSTFYIGQFPSPMGEPNPFGVPYQRNCFFSGRQAVLEHLHKQLNQDDITAITQVQAISGLGGVGKTQTAVEYAYRHYHDQRNYDYVFWIKADTEINLATDFAKLANQLVLPIATSTQEEKISAVHHWLATHNNWLLIFDNADTPDWLPSCMPNSPQGKVLITSRASVFDQCNIESPLPLDVLSSDEAIDLLFCRTGYERTETHIAAATEINRELDGLPLALEQASAFITRRKVSFQTYLNTYKERGLSQLEKVKAKTGQYPSSVLRTWKINFEALAEEQPAAADLLKFSAFLASDEIPYRILEVGATFLGEVLGNNLKANNEDETLLAIGSLLDALSQYSLVKWKHEQKSYSVHRLVQSVVRDELLQPTQKKWIERSITTVAAAYPGSDYQDWPICTQLLPHWLRVIELAQDVNLESEVLGLVLNQAGSFLDNQGRYSEAKPLYQEALAIRQHILGNEHPDVACSLNSLACLYTNQGYYSKAEPLHQEALAMRQHLLGNEHPDVASSLNNLATVYHKQGRYKDAEPLYQEALALNKNLLGNEHPDVALSLNNLAELYSKQGRYKDAEPLYQEALTLNKKLWDGHPHVALNLNNLAGLYKKQGRYKDAEPLYQEALALNKKLLGDQHPHIAMGLNNLGDIYRIQGYYNRAKPLYQEALALNKNLLGDQHPHIATSLNNLAEIYSKEGYYSKAKALHQEALVMRQRLFGNEHPDVASSLNNLATVYHKQGHYSEAKPLYQKALAMRQHLLGNKHPHVALSLNNLAELYSQQGHYNKAKFLHHEALEIDKHLLGSEHPDVALDLNNLATIYHKQGHHSKAKSLLQEALVICEKILETEHPTTQLIQRNLQACSTKTDALPQWNSRIAHTKASGFG